MLNKIIFLLLFLTGTANAHGVGYKNSDLKAVPLEFFYSTGEKMSYCDVKIFSPVDNKFTFQTGRTDLNGRFSFIPDVNGKWLIIVNDGQGHQCNAELEINLNLNLNSEYDIKINNNDNNLILNSVLGVSIIFNLAFIIKKHYAHK